MAFFISGFICFVILAALYGIEVSVKKPYTKVFSQLLQSKSLLLQSKGLLLQSKGLLLQSKGLLLQGKSLGFVPAARSLRALERHGYFYGKL